MDTLLALWRVLPGTGWVAIGVFIVVWIGPQGLIGLTPRRRGAAMPRAWSSSHCASHCASACTAGRLRALSASTRA